MNITRLIVTLTGNLMNIYQDHETAQTGHINQLTIVRFSPSDCLFLRLLSFAEQNNSYNSENRNVSYFEDRTWCVLLLGEMLDYVSYIVFNNLLHLMCKDFFACHILFLKLPCPPEKEIMSKVSTLSILRYL